METNLEKIKDLLTNKKYNELKKILNELNSADIPGILEEFDKEDVIRIFRLLSKEQAGEAFSYMESDMREKLLEDLTDSEIAIFKKQLDIGEETKTKVIVHTPRKNKKEVLKVIQDIVPQHIDPKLVVIDHINQNVAEDVIDKDYTLGLTVQPQKMDKEEAIAILDEYGFDKFLLNSDISNKPSDPLSVPKTVRELEKLGYKKTGIEKVAFKNAEKFFKI